MKRILTLMILAFALVSHANAAEFKFIAFGDMPYGNPERMHPIFETLIDTINAREPAFAIHIGDTKSGGQECSNEVLDKQLSYMNTFDHPLLYIPGDNEWTDCHFERAGGYDPRERLAYIRKTYFADPTTSLGRQSMPVESQAVAMSDRFSDFVENTRFVKDSVHFVQAHVVGSNNGFEARDLETVQEFFERDQANVAWLNHAFDRATSENAAAMVVSIHADMFEFGFGPSWDAEAFLRHSGFKKFGETLVKRANAFQKPVLLIYGDSHIFRVLRPFPKGAPNIMALEVFGARDMHAVEVKVNTEKLAIFGIEPVLNPALLRGTALR